MPIYGYQCQACGHGFEVMQKMNDPAPGACPSCGQSDIRKQLSAAGIQLKGNGWYATDYKAGKKDADSSESGPQTGGCGSGGCGGCAL